MNLLKTGFAAFALAALAGRACAQDTASGPLLALKECVETALKNNLTVNQYDITAQTSKIGYDQARGNFLPVISASGTQGEADGRSIDPYTNQPVNEKIRTGSYSLSGSLLLFSGLVQQNQLRQTRYAWEANKLDWQQQKDNITLAVLLAYLQVLSNQDILEIARQQKETDARQVERLELQNADGAIAPSTLYDLKGKFASDEIAVLSAVNAVATAKINLFQLMNVPYQGAVRFERLSETYAYDSAESTTDSLYATALQALPMIKAANLRTLAFRKALSAARGAYYPTLSLYGGMASNYSSAATTTTYGPNVYAATDSYVSVGGVDNFLYSKQPSFTDVQKTAFGDQFNNNLSKSFGIQLQIPILNRLVARNNVKLARVNLRNQEIVANYTKVQLQRDVETARQNMTLAAGEVKSYANQMAAYAESFHAADIKFRAGAITSVDYVIAKNNIDAARVNFTAAQYNLIFRSKILDYYRGRLSW